MDQPYRHADLYNAFRCAQLFEFARTWPDQGEYDLGPETRRIIERLLPQAAGGQFELALGEAYAAISNLPRQKRLRLDQPDPSAMLVREKLCAAGVLYAGSKWAELAGLGGANWASGKIDGPPFPYIRQTRLVMGNMHYFFRCYGEFDDDAAATLERDPTWSMEVDQDQIATVVPVIVGRRSPDTYENPWTRRYRLSNGQQVYTLTYRDPRDPSGQTRKRRSGDKEIFESTEQIVAWVDALWEAYRERPSGSESPFTESFRSPRRVAENWEYCRLAVGTALQATRFRFNGNLGRNPFACHYPGRCAFEKVCWR